ncbi:MAG: tryptophan synthase subunit alpha [Opitutae bacterium]|nr:tryptophan synthase subunit alpha [Opitutae bacterium]MCD8298864.1 tryptophan synthase subunit alpha [Opitutae bacterium]
MSRYEKLFSELSAKNEGAFVPFVTLGDPDKATSLAIVEALLAGGADALELGLPFSDPLADGPTIQAADKRALDAGITPDDCFEIIATVRARHATTPIGLLVYANLVHKRGYEKFFSDALAAGADSILLADVPVEMSEPFRKVSQQTGLQLVFIAPPNADAETLAKISEFGGGYTYLLSRAGVTGAEVRAEMPVANVLAELKTHSSPPPVLGFGISEPPQVRAAIDAGAAGAISGSAVVKIIEKNRGNVPAMLDKLKAFAAGMKAATKR